MAAKLLKKKAHKVSPKKKSAEGESGVSVRDSMCVCVAIMIVCAPICALTAFAAGVAVEPLPAPEFADTEVVTNIAISISCDNLSRLKFSTDLQASPSNNVEVAIGYDANSDGHLSVDESAFVVGYDCGEWFARSAAKDSIEFYDSAGTGAACRTFAIRAGKVDPQWNLVRVTRRGLCLANESVTIEQVASGFLLKMQ